MRLTQAMLIAIEKLTITDCTKTTFMKAIQSFGTDISAPISDVEKFDFENYGRHEGLDRTCDANQMPPVCLASLYTKCVSQLFACLYMELQVILLMSTCE
jgi:hypothetical protein